MAPQVPAARRSGPVSLPVVAGVAAGLVALVVGLMGIGRSFNYDEAFTYAFFVRGGSVRRALTTQVVFNNHPPFSAILAVLWRLGVVGETGQRLVPVTFGAVTVGVLTGSTVRRLGWLPGVAAGAVLLLDPEFLLQYRSLRGYSLATLAIVLSGLAIERSWTDHRRRWLVVQGAGAVIAVTTHVYSALALAVFAVVTVAMGRLRRAHLVTWALSAVVAVVVVLPVLDDALRTAGARGTRFDRDFPIVATRYLLGDGPVVAVLVGALALLGAVAIARTSRRHLAAVLAASGVVVGAVFVVWFVVRPFDLYPRFFGGLLPLVAYLVARGLATLPTGAAAVAALVVVALLVPGARRVVEVEPAIREAAAVVDRARGADLSVCGRDVEPLTAYTAPVAPRDPAGDLGGCDVYVAVIRVDPEEAEALADRYGARERLTGGTTIWARPATLEAMTGER